MSPAQLLERPSIEVRLGELPVLPAVMVRLMSLSPQSEELFEEVLAVAQEDPGFALRVMQIANSAMSSPVADPDLGAGCCPSGAAHVADLVTTVAMTRVFVPRTPQEKDLWRRRLSKQPPRAEPSSGATRSRVSRPSRATLSASCMTLGSSS